MSSYPEVFEGWAAHGKDCLEGKFKKTQYKPKVNSLPEMYTIQFNVDLKCVLIG